MNMDLIRRNVIDLCLQLSARGYLAGTGGNIALRVDAQRFAVTPSAVDYHAMQPEDVCILNLADLRQLEGARTPSVESSLHARVLRARPDVHCSIHTHQPVASACALLGRDVGVDDAQARRVLGPRVPMVGYAPSGTGWLASKLARAIRPDVNAYLLLNHGALCCGTDAAAAVQAVEALEELARTHLLHLISFRAAAQPQLKLSLWRVTDALTTP
jgi:L-fuculose-phosphate aldolase